MTKLDRMWVLMGVLLLLSPLAASAASIEAESIELDTRFSFDHNSISIDTGLGDVDYSVTQLMINAGVGYFFNPNWEGLGTMLVDHYGLGGDLDGSLTDFGLTAAARYHFNTDGSVIPFVGAGLGIVMHGGDTADDNASFIAPELVAGLRWPFRDVVSLNLSGGYRHETSPLGIDDAGGNDFFLAFGFTYFLQGGAAQ